MEAGFRVDGYSVVRLTSTDAADLQDLFERCTDFHELSEGFPTPPTAGAEELVARPAGKDLADKFYFGIYAPGGELIGYIDLMRNYPAEREWWIGLLLLDPAARGGGLGRRIYRAAAEWVRTQGGAVIYLGVLEQNTTAERFWRREGFEELRRDSYVLWHDSRSRVGSAAVRISRPTGSMAEGCGCSRISGFWDGARRLEGN